MVILLGRDNEDDDAEEFADPVDVVRVIIDEPFWDIIAASDPSGLRGRKL